MLTVRENLGCLRKMGRKVLLWVFLPSTPPPPALGGSSDHWTAPFKGWKLATLFIVHILAEFSPGFYDHPTSELFLPLTYASDTTEE